VAATPLLLRVVHNRDEQLTRPAGLPPAALQVGARRAVMPIDPQSGGTWIAVNDAGLVFAILNAYPKVSNATCTWAAGSRRSPAVSRGAIIPALLESATVSDALVRAQRLQAKSFAPFRLLVFDRFQLAECWPHGDRIRQQRSAISAAVMRTSSGLGDAVVAGPRRELFDHFLSHPDDARGAQDRFHQHRWIEREAVSVNMRRGDARTVSHTVVEVGCESVSMSYRAADSPQPVVVRVAA